MSSYAENFKQSNFSDEISLRNKSRIIGAAGTLSRFDKSFLRNTSTQGIGEPLPTLEQKLERYEHYRVDPRLNENQYSLLNRTIPKVNEYEDYGLKVGLFLGTVVFFFPGIRLLPFYYRIPLSSFVIYRSVVWGRNYGLDLCEVRLRHTLESQERNDGIRFFYSQF